MQYKQAVDMRLKGEAKALKKEKRRGTGGTQVASNLI
jgi:hypothetical protein